MGWIRLDPQELGTAGLHLRDIGLALDAAQQRIRTACCTPGLGRHGGPLMAEGDAVAGRIVQVTENYLILAVDTLARAILAARENALVTSVPVVGAILPPTGGPSDIINTPTGPKDWRLWGIDPVKGLHPAFLAAANAPSIGGSAAPTVRGGADIATQLNNNQITNQIMKGIDARNGVMTVPGIAPTYNAMKNYQNNVSAIGYKGVRAETYRNKTGY